MQTPADRGGGKGSCVRPQASTFLLFQYALQTLSNSVYRTSCNRRSFPTLYLGAGDPCRRYPGPCLAALGGQTRTRRSEKKACVL